MTRHQIRTSIVNINRSRPNGTEERSFVNLERQTINDGQCGEEEGKKRGRATSVRRRKTTHIRKEGVVIPLQVIKSKHKVYIEVKRTPIVSTLKVTSKRWKRRLYC